MKSIYWSAPWLFLWKCIHNKSNLLLCFLKFILLGVESTKILLEFFHQTSLSLHFRFTGCNVGLLLLMLYIKVLHLQLQSFYLLLDIQYPLFGIINLILQPLVTGCFIIKLSSPPLLLIEDAKLSFSICYPAYHKACLRNLKFIQVLCSRSG
jgi:hypothetical protein